MSRKSLFFGGIVLLLTMLLILPGCSNSVSPGEPGPAGPTGPGGSTGPQGNEVQGPPGVSPKAYMAGPTVTFDELELFFIDNDKVVLSNNVTSVSGTVPAGKTLYVLGDVSVGSGLTLEAGAKVELYAESSTLRATGIGNGVLESNGGSVVGKGTIFLPIAVENFTYNGPVLHYDSGEISGALKKYPGSAITSSSNTPVAFDSATIKTYFANRGDTLAVYDITGLTADAIPAGKTLTLKGSGNTTDAGGLTLASTARLIVDTNDTLTINGAFAVDTNGAFTNKGNVTLASGAVISNSAGGSITNDGVITGAVDTNDTGLEALLGLTGTGSILAKNSVTLTGTNNPLKQRLVIATGVTITGPSGVAYLFSSVDSGKTITIESGATLALDADNTSSGTKVINKGTITTATTATSVLATIFSEMVDKKGAVSTSGIVVFDSTAALEIPAEVTLTLGSAATLGGAAGNLTVKGTLIASGATLAPLGDVAIDGTLTLTGGTLSIASGKTLTAPAFSSAKPAVFSGAGTITAASVTIGETTGYAAAALPTSDFATYSDAIDATIAKLTDSVSVSSGDFSGKGVEKIIGSVDVTPGGAEPIKVSASGAGDSIVIPDDAAITTTAWVFAGTPSGFDVTDFDLDVDSGTNELTLEDTGTISGSDKLEILTINKYRITMNGGELVSPEKTTAFHIGVKTKR